MLARMIPHPDQIRWYAQSALSAFETLDTDTAIETARAELEALLSYLDRADDSSVVLGVSAVETRVRNELVIGNDNPSGRDHDGETELNIVGGTRHDDYRSNGPRQNQGRAHRET